ncbi:hypothetical protein ACFB49_36430 [Sphingomonas sp. DBB INV C78]|uniref:transglutaminase-like domain-containing protein n=1 Tax=Sphingomonas sp. DBB INV C78 TaxID=3349434 RepID=UPI0036D21A30
MRFEISTELNYRADQATDLLLMVEVAAMHDQQVVESCLTINGTPPTRTMNGTDAIGRRAWAGATGDFHAEYRAIVRIDRRPVAIAGLAATPLRDLPDEAIPYLWPSRYCEADRLEAMVCREFGDREGGDKVLAMMEWIHTHVDYCVGTSNTATTAIDTLVARQGVCRDFAHLLAAFIRAGGMPARLVSAYAWKLDPPDFHAVVEVWLDGAWHLVDATRLAPTESLARIAVGRDATDIAFMTSFAPIELVTQTVDVRKLD